MATLEACPSPVSEPGRPATGLRLGDSVGAGPAELATGRQLAAGDPTGGE